MFLGKLIESGPNMDAFLTSFTVQQFQREKLNPKLEFWTGNLFFNKLLIIKLIIACFAHLVLMFSVSHIG